LKRAIQEISRLRGELRFLQTQNAQLLASQNGQNDGRIIQNIPQENIIQHKPLIFPKQEILMATVEDKQQQYQYNSHTNVKNFGQEQTQIMVLVIFLNCHLTQFENRKGVKGRNIIGE